MTAIPADVGPVATKVMLAVLAGATTFSDAAARAGVSLGSAAWQLGVLQKHGLVTWEAESEGTLRPTVRVVQTDPSGS